MKKSARIANRKKEVEETTADKEDNDVIDSMEERLRRVELAHAQNSSDGYKFAFFFFMGVVLTIIIYPGVSNTIESLRHQKRTVVHSEAKHNAVQHVGGNKEEGRIKGSTEQADNLTEANESKEMVNKYRHEDLMVDERSESNIESEQLSLFDEEQNEYADDFESKQEDTLVSQASHTADEQIEIPLKLTPMDSESGKVMVELKPDETELQAETVNKQTKKKPPLTQKSMKSEPTKSTPDAAETKSTMKKSEESSNKKPNVPKEIQDFKPTFLKSTKPKKIFADGRRIPPMELLPQKPNNSSVKVWMFEEFLSEQECDGLMRVHNQHVKDQSKDDPIICFDSIATLRKHLKHAGKHHVHVTPRDFTDGTTCVNSSFSGKLKIWLKGNWSYSTAFYPGESRFASIFEHRVEQAMGLTPANGGKFQITSYPLDIGYKSHTDCMEDSDLRDRVATVLVYLDTVEEGGETDFPELGIWVRPRKGRALMWNNMDESGRCEPLSIHQAKKVVKGHKYILQRWYYYKSFFSLGKRPPEPPLPVRSPGQPRVSCDEFEHGSCRWYDEWNFEHLVEYERQKYTLI